MSFSRQALTMRPVLRPYSRALTQTPLQPFGARFASGDYGSGEGDPKGEKPQEQGKSQATRDKEHPGPQAPDVGQKSRSSSSSGSEDQRSSGANAEVGGKKPTILRDEPKSGLDESVKEHNEEVERRKERMGQSKHAHNASE